MKLRPMANLALLLPLVCLVVSACDTGQPPTAPAVANTPVAISNPTVPPAPASATLAPTPVPASTASPTTPAAVGPTRAPGAGGSHLLQALAFAPATVTSIEFTDWALIKSYKGVPDLSSQSSADARLQFILSIGRDQAAAAAFGLNHFRDHVDNWGWDSTDLVWEANFDGLGPPLTVLQFRADFDPAPVVAHFTARGFSQSTYQGADLYSHALAPDQDWTTTTDFGILNTAVLAGDKRFVLSASADNVRAALDTAHQAGSGLDADANMRSLAGPLEPTATAMVLRGTDLCGPPARTQNPADAATMTAAASGLHAYTALGVSYHDQDSRPVGTLVLDFADAASAQADLAPRRSLAADGMSMRARKPYSATVFTVASATVAVRDLVLTVRPLNDQPDRLLTMVYERDLLFAACR